MSGESSLSRLAAFLAQPPPQLAMDRRVIDQDGHLTVSSSIIRAEAVNPYLGGEIPDYERQGTCL